MLNLCSWIYNYVVNVCDTSTVEVGVQHAVQRICELSPQRFDIQRETSVARICRMVSEML